MGQPRDHSRDTSVTEVNPVKSRLPLGPNERPCAFDLIGAAYLHEVDPGEMVVIGPEGVTRERWTPEQPRSQCVFEHVYFSRPDSIVFGRSVEESRENLGRLLARECPADADIVVPVPDSGVAAALGYSDESGLPFRHALIRNHYVGRTFIEPSQAIRDFGVKLKLNPVRHLLQGQRVILVDDSIVRGTTSRKIVRMVRQAGARVKCICASHARRPFPRATTAWIRPIRAS